MISLGLCPTLDGERLGRRDATTVAIQTLGTMRMGYAEPVIGTRQTSPRNASGTTWRTKRNGRNTNEHIERVAVGRSCSMGWNLLAISRCWQRRLVSVR